MPNTTNIFGVPASPANFIRPGKRPMSSMCPAIIWDESQNRVRMVTGSSGGTEITTSNAMNIIDVLWLNRSLPESVDHKRFHHQCIPPYLQLEEGFPKDIEKGLEAKGHKIETMKSISVIQAINVHGNGKIVGTADFRKGGGPAGF
ncbi:gamma-glutamyltranspeptidase 1 [Plakobranchus ocellatus]|uniref:Gamma-glutamyltranspeptidase 1 n=1 Tax=Plakobranchus ocellatus TaxID=259542 RepID=A0AAV4CXQ2_9GAST|nr:gamma-glutamyltranspeptidase 1 [Plakobranchus ocellatus]